MARAKPTLRKLTKEIKDPATLEAIEGIFEFLSQHPLVKTYWEHYVFETDVAVTKARVRHNLAVVPKDIVLTFKTGAGNVSFDYEDFDGEYIRVTTTGAAKIRFLAGTVVGGGNVDA